RAGRAAAPADRGAADPRRGHRRRRVDPRAYRGRARPWHRGPGGLGGAERGDGPGRSHRGHVRGPDYRHLRRGGRDGGGAGALHAGCQAHGRGGGVIGTLTEAPVAGPSLRERALGVGLAILRPVAVVAVALLIGIGIIIYTGQNPLPAYENLLIEPLGSWDTFSSVLFYAIPLVLTGLAAAAAFRANIFNIGGEGQLQVGALATAWAALSWARLPAVLLVPLIILVGAVGGALWAGIAGWLRAYLGATELVSTIMLNY